MRRLARERGASLSELVREAVDRLIAARPDQASDRRRRALAVIGRFESGRRDVSRRHDEHLDEAFRP